MKWHSASQSVPPAPPLSHCSSQPVCTMPSPHVIDDPETHAPPRHSSVSVHVLPSSHDVPSGAVGFEHVPLCESHAPATWHASSGVHTTASPPTHCPAPSHASTRVHASASSHAMP